MSTTKAPHRPCDDIRDARMHFKEQAARKAIRRTFRSFLRTPGITPEIAAQLTIAWTELMDGTFEGDQP
jgi:anti-sigma regulatory factor (Ser/Thr protein kinase)